MTEKSFPRFRIQDVPEFQRFRDANPQNPTIDSLQAMIMYGRAIHWIAILDILWPAFDSLDYYRVEVAYIVANDPDEGTLPSSFFEYIAQKIATFWELQLQQKYPLGDWTVSIHDDPEITVDVEIRSRN